MGDRINIFSLARRGHAGQENQMIELLAYLFQQQPELIGSWLADLDPETEWPSDWQVSTQHVLPTRRRPDLLLEVPGQAAVLVEVKLGSGEGENQLADYAEYLRKERSEPLRRLVYLAKDNVAASPAAAHTTPTVPVFAATWQRLQQMLLSGVPGPLTDDFAAMLREEGLAMPEPVSELELHQWEAGALVIRRLQQLLDAARPGLEALVPDRNWTGPLATSLEKMYRLYGSDRITIGVGFNPGSLWGYAATVDCYVMDKAPEPAARRHAARALQATHPELVSAVEWGETPKRSRLAAEVLTGSAFNEQVEQLIEFARESLALFAEAGYPPPP